MAAFCAAALLGGSFAPPARAQNNLPALGDAAAEDFGVGAERRLGEQVMREIRRDPDYVDDPLLLEYLQSIWQPLVARSRAIGNIAPELDERFSWEPFLVRDPSVNAFALPGGYIGVHLGLMAITASRDELASVLAHELTHVTQRHIARGFANSKRQSLIGLAALIVGVLAASRAGSSSSGDAANAVIAGSQAVALQGQLNFSRDMEREADRIGWQVMTGAGFSPAGMALMFEKLEHAARLNDNGSYPYLRSHPLTTERIGEARSRMGTLLGAPTALQRNPLEHALAQARARVLMDTRIDALRRWQAQDQLRSGEPTEQLMAQAGSALASALLREPARADAALARAQALLDEARRGETRAQRALALLRTQALLARGDGAAAATALQPWLADGGRPVTLMTAQLALAVAGPAHARDAALKASADELQTLVAQHPLDSTGWLLLSQVWGHLAQPLRSVRAEAEAQLALGDMPGAIDRLRAGQRMARSGSSADFIEASVIDSRLRAVQAEFRLLSAEERRQ